jgi:DNA-binding MarR family transcriptional regulator
MPARAANDVAAPARVRKPIRLQQFLPYRLAVLAEQVSRTLAHIYADRFDLSRPEWRVLAGLAELGEIPAKDISDHTTLDKMAVSRAVAALEAKGHLTRSDDPHDRRNRILHLTPSGRALYERVVPLALAREEYLLGALAPEDRAALDRILTALLTRARELERVG